jgi:hypothetical protein
LATAPIVTPEFTRFTISGGYQITAERVVHLEDLTVNRQNG